LGAGSAPLQILDAADRIAASVERAG
jgi:hypothetical protein